MSKQKIILFVSILLLVVLTIVSYFYIESQRIVLPVDTETDKDLTEDEVNENKLKELQSFTIPTDVNSAPYSLQDPTIKDPVEIKEELDSYVPAKDPEKPSNEDILELLKNVN